MMTNEEMRRYYESYPYKKDAITILARQNGIDQEAVKDALREAGLDGRKLPRDRKPPTQSTRASLSAAAKKRWARNRKPAEPEPVEPTEAGREAFRFIFGGILPGVEPL